MSDGDEERTDGQERRAASNSGRRAAAGSSRQSAASSRQRTARQRRTVSATARRGRTGTRAHTPVDADADSSVMAAARSTRLTQAAMGGGLHARHPRGMSLRAKFMLAFMSVTGCSLILLGLVLGWASNFFLFSQTQHKGVELAKMASSLYRSVLDRYGASSGVLRSRFSKQDAEEAIKRYLDQARTWGDDTPDDGFYKSHIRAVHIYGTDLAPAGTGPLNQRPATIAAPTKMFIPGQGSTPLPDDVSFYEFDLHTENEGTIPVYRFRVGVRQGGDDVSYMDTDSIYVSLDMDIANVYAVRNYIILIIIAVLLLGLIVSFIVANRMANNITKPVKILLHDIAQVAQGDLKHETRMHSSDEIGMLANAFNSMTADLDQATSEIVEQEAQEKQRQYELATAQEVQQQLLPAEKPVVQDYEVESYYQAARGVSGDYYDCIELGEGKYGFIIADVSGKGIPGSMVMAVTRTIVRLIAAQHGASAGQTLKMTNRLIAKQIKRGMFVTSFYAIVDTVSHTVNFASAGHNPMVLYRAGKGYELQGAKGIAIGFDQGPLFEKNMQEGHAQINPGDAVVLYTDGFPEAMNAENQEFGDERFYNTVASFGHLPAQALIDQLVNVIAQHRGDAPQSDDLTMLIVRRSP